MSAPELDAEMVRLYYAEHWRVGTIATQLGVHPDVVRRVLGLGQQRLPGPPRPRLVDPYRDFIAETLERYPRLRSTRLYDMLRERGYQGSPRSLPVQAPPGNHWRRGYCARHTTDRRLGLPPRPQVRGGRSSASWAKVLF